MSRKLKSHIRLICVALPMFNCTSSTLTHTHNCLFKLAFLTRKHEDKVIQSNTCLSEIVFFEITKADKVKTFAIFHKPQRADCWITHAVLSKWKEKLKIHTQMYCEGIGGKLASVMQCLQEKFEKVNRKFLVFFFTNFLVLSNFLQF